MSNSTLVLALCVLQIAMICAFIFVLKHYCSMLPFRLVARMFRECGKGKSEDDREALVANSASPSPYPQFIPSIYSPQMMPSFQQYPGYQPCPMSPYSMSPQSHPMSPQSYPMGQQPFQMAQQPFPGQQQQPYMMSSPQSMYPAYAMNQPFLMPPTNYPHQMGISPATPPAPPSYTTANAQAGTEKQEAEEIIQM